MCDRIEDIERAGADLVVVGNGTVAQAKTFAAEQRPPVRVLTDPNRNVFRAIGARRGRLSSLRPEMVLASLRAWRNGRRSRGIQGDPWQQGAVWVVAAGGDLRFRHTSTWAGDHPDPDEVLSALTNR